MAKGCVYIPKTGKDAGKVFGSKESLAAHMNYTPALTDLMSKFEQSGGKADIDSVTKWLTDNGYLKEKPKGKPGRRERLSKLFEEPKVEVAPTKEAEVEATPEMTPEEVRINMKPITDEMAGIEMEFANNGYSIDWDYDNEIIITDKNGEIVDAEELPKKLLPLAAQYEKATAGLAGYDFDSYQKALEQSRKDVGGIETEFEEVKPAAVPEKTEEKPKSKLDEKKAIDQSVNELINKKNRYNKIAKKRKPLAGNLLNEIKEEADRLGFATSPALGGNVKLVSKKDGKAVSRRNVDRKFNKERNDKVKAAKAMANDFTFGLRGSILLYFLNGGKISTTSSELGRDSKELQAAKKAGIVSDTGISASSIAKEDLPEMGAAVFDELDTVAQIQDVVASFENKEQMEDELVDMLDKFNRDMEEAAKYRSVSEMNRALDNGELNEDELVEYYESLSEDDKIKSIEDYEKFYREIEREQLDQEGEGTRGAYPSEGTTQEAQEQEVGYGSPLSSVEETIKALDELANDDPDAYSNLEKQAGVMYHGTEADFEKFGRVGQRIPALGLGYYFTPRLEKAKQYGSKIKKIVLEDAKILNWNKLSNAEREQIKKRLEERMPKSMLGGLGERKEKIFTQEQRQEASDFYKQKREETDNYEYERGKARIKRNGDVFVISWSEEGLGNLNDAELLNFAQRYDNDIAKEMGYDAAKYGDEIAVFNGDKIKNATNEVIAKAYQKAKEDGSNPGLVKAVEDLIGNKKITDGPNKGLTQTDTAAGPFVSESGNTPYSERGGVRGQTVREGGVGNTVKAVWNKYKQIKFNGSIKVKDAEDVAHIMRKLEDKSVEHAFAVHVDKNGKTHIQFLGMGGPTATVVDPRLVLAGAKKFKSKKVYLVHNHPSGSLAVSSQDMQLTKTVAKVLEPLDIDVEHVIMDTYRKEYVHIDSDETSLVKKRDLSKESLEEYNKALKVQLMDEQKILSEPVVSIQNSADVADFLMQLRFTALPKHGMLLLNQNKQVIGNYIFKKAYDYNETTSFIAQAGVGTLVIFYTNQGDYNLLLKTTRPLEAAGIKVLDYVVVNSESEGVKGYYQSFADSNRLLETQAEYGTNSIPNELRELAPRSNAEIQQLMEDSMDAVDNAIESGKDAQSAVNDLIGNKDWYFGLTAKQKTQFDEILQDEFGVVPTIEQKVEAKAAPTGVGEDIRSIVDNYYKLKDGDRSAKDAINEILDADPKLKYIYDNIRKINKQLQEAGVITDKTDGCP